MPAYDSYIAEHGTAISDLALKKMLVSKKDIQDKIDNTFAYEDTPSVIPGKPIDDTIDRQLESLNEDTGMNSLITQAAMMKAKDETDKREALKQKAEQRKNFIESMMYQQGELYYQQHHYFMDGKTKRRVRKAVERAYDKGKYNKSGIYFEQPPTKTIIRKPKNTNKEPVNMQDMLKM